MQTIEKALHQPMPFTTGGQTISDRLTAAKHSLAGSQLGKTICKATTEELMAPKKKHLDYLLHCTNEPNVSIPSMANLLIERTQHPSWTVVYKALITIHNIMCYGNERFSQYLASCNTTFNLGNFLDKNSTSGYDMSQHVRRYGKYIGEKIATYRVCAFDFCKVKRGREDGLLRTMHTDKLLKTLPILQNQIDALLEFHVSSSELNNGVINCSFILLFRDLIRLFACYNDGIINLLEKYFDMNKKQCREALDTYKGFLTRLDKVADFLRVAESVGIDRGEIPDLTRAPASLLEALESHLIHLEGGRAPPPANQFTTAQSQVNNFSIAGGFQAQAQVGDAERQRYIELEKERLRQFEEQKRQQASTGQFNPFAADVSAAAPSRPAEPKKTNDDLLDLFNTAPAQIPAAQDQLQTNPFAQFAPIPSTMQHPMYPMGMNQVTMFPMTATTSAYPTAFTQQNGNGLKNAIGGEINPFANVAPASAAPPAFNPFMAGFAEGTTGGEVQTSAVIAEPQPTHHEPEQSAPIPLAQQQRLGIYEQTPFSHSDGSYTAPVSIPSHVLQHISAASSAEQSPAHQGYAQPAGGTFDPFNTTTPLPQTSSGNDVDSTISSLDSMSLHSKPSTTNAGQWGAAPPARPPVPGVTSVNSAMQMPYSAAQTQYGAYTAQYGAPQMQWSGMQPGVAYGMAQPQYGMYQQQMPYGMNQVQQPMQQMASPQVQPQQPKDPFSGY